MRTSRFARPTDLVSPLDETQPEHDPVADAEAAAAELDWSFHDAELTSQLKAVHEGRGRVLVILAGSVLAIAAAIAITV